MATRWYLPASAASTPISPTVDAAWEDSSILARAMTSTSPISDAMATVAFDDSNDTDKDILFRQYISQPLTAGQTITGAQAIKAQVRGLAGFILENMSVALGIRVIAADGSTVQKTVLAVTRDNVNVTTTLTNRQFTATSAATNYTTIAGDRLVFELGTGGDPNALAGHDTSLRLGDSAASDLPEDDTDTTDLRPWVELADTLTVDAGVIPRVMHHRTKCLGV